MADRNFKDFSVAYSIFKMTSEESAAKTDTFAKALNVGCHIAKRVVTLMVRNNLIDAKRGLNSKGIKRVKGASIKSVFDLYNIEYQPEEEIEPLIKVELSKSRYQNRRCRDCRKEITFSYSVTVCYACRTVEEPPVITKLARCGHPSEDRYFKCSMCLPKLPEDSWEEEGYSVHL
jgi:hypothetical protein